MRWDKIKHHWIFVYCFHFYFLHTFDGVHICVCFFFWNLSFILFFDDLNYLLYQIYYINTWFAFCTFPFFSDSKFWLYFCSCVCVYVCVNIFFCLIFILNFIYKKRCSHLLTFLGLNINMKFKIVLINLALNKRCCWFFKVCVVSQL